MGSSCCCDTGSGGAGRKIAAGAVAVAVLCVAVHAQPGHKPAAAAKPAAAVVADAAGRPAARPRPAHAARAGVAIAYARRQLGRPYEWGGTGPGGYDCSGLVYEAWRAAGVAIPRTTFKAWPALRHIGRSYLRPGDLIFYAGSDGSQGNPGHVVMYIGGGWVIQAFETGTNVMLTRLADVTAGPLTGYARPGGG